MIIGAIVEKEAAMETTDSRDVEQKKCPDSVPPDRFKFVYWMILLSGKFNNFGTC